MGEFTPLVPASPGGGPTAQRSAVSAQVAVSAMGSRGDRRQQIPRHGREGSF